MYSHTVLLSRASWHEAHLSVGSSCFCKWTLLSSTAFSFVSLRKHCVILLFSVHLLRLSSDSLITDRFWNNIGRHY